LKGLEGLGRTRIILSSFLGIDDVLPIHRILANESQGLKPCGRELTSNPLKTCQKKLRNTESSAKSRANQIPSRVDRLLSPTRLSWHCAVSAEQLSLLTRRPLATRRQAWSRSKENSYGRPE
jgi:hypothetical protein